MDTYIYIYVCIHMMPSHLLERTNEQVTVTSSSIAASILPSHASWGSLPTCANSRLFSNGVYVCMYVCMYVCLHLCMYVLLFVCMYVCIQERMYLCICASMHTYMRTPDDFEMLSTRTHWYTDAHTHTRAHARTHTHTLKYKDVGNLKLTSINNYMYTHVRELGLWCTKRTMATSATLIFEISVVYRLEKVEGE